jgi:hypothetical protein
MSERSESNGGGGNRTRVLWSLDVGLYVRSSSINVARERHSEQSLGSSQPRRSLASAVVAWADASLILQPAFGLLRRGFLGRG